MIYKTPKEEVDAYYDSPAINQSLLKKLDKGHPIGVTQEKEPERYYEEKKHFIIGSLVDALKCSTEEDLLKTYYPINIVKKPSDGVMSVLQWAFDNYKKYEEQWNSTLSTETNRIGLNTITFEEFYLSHFWKYILYCSCNENKYYMNRFKENWQEDKRYESIEKDAGYLPYLEMLFESQGKQIISEGEFNIAKQIVMSFDTNSRVSNYFKDDKHLTIIYQLPIYFVSRTNTNKEFKSKALLDKVIIDHKNKVIVPCDFKTYGQEIINFPSEIRSRRYDIQAAYYTDALIWLLADDYYRKQFVEKYNLPNDIKDYQILNFRFIVETTNPIFMGTPSVFVCHRELLNIGRDGKPEQRIIYYDMNTNNPVDESVTKEVLGYKQLLDLYEWYSENGFEKRKELVEESTFTVGWNGIIKKSK